MLKDELSKEEILKILKEIKSIYLKEGIEILGLFGSYARNEQNYFSDIDIAYKINHKVLSNYCDNGFAKLIRLNEIKEELEKIFKKKIDFVSNKNQKILEGIIYV